MSEDTRYRLTNMFYSIQGESVYAGTPSLWVRTFGCNLKCPGFPCDTEYAWNKSFIDETQYQTSREIYEDLLNLNKTVLNPIGLLRHPVTKNDIHLVFTGGEPLLKRYQQMIMEVVDMFAENNSMVYFTIETNGTQPLTYEFKQWYTNHDTVELNLSISPKLPSVSGELHAIDYDNIVDYCNLTTVNIKLVANNTDQCELEVLEFVDTLNSKAEYAPDAYWIMPFGETCEEQLTVAPIVERYQELGFKIATRNHTYIWSNEKAR